MTFVTRTGARGVLFLVPTLLGVGCLDVREKAYEDDESCTRCHGDSTRDAGALVRAAPPSDLKGSTDVSYPGVGAHSIHLLPGETHGPIACDECHVVPDRVDTPGHADDTLPAELTFGKLSRSGDRSPDYDSDARTCNDTYCHGDSRAVWTRPRTTEDACGSCHALPPALPHPQTEDCSLCHGEVIDHERHFTAPELHVDGRLQARELDCSSCHGSAESPAPPPDLAGNTAPSAQGVGAHMAHLETQSARVLACDECHLLPPETSPLSHVDGSPASVTFSGVATSRDRDATWDRQSLTCNDTWCHGLGDGDGHASPAWTSTDDLGCTGCHGSPPPAPHPPASRCESCHAEVASGPETIRAPELHVNGIVNVDVPTACNSCHGSGGAAPPRDVSGNTDTTFSGVGAHQAHVVGSGLARPVPCDECHVPIDELSSPGHFDTPLPAEIVFSGVATAYGATPTYDGASCLNSYCHGADFEESRVSGGSLTAPSWTTVDGSQAACGTCHGLPPPIGHPQVDDCSSCHRNVRPDNESFFDPALHVNGIPETVLR